MRARASRGQSVAPAKLTAREAALALPIPRLLLQLQRVVDERHLRTHHLRRRHRRRRQRLVLRCLPHAIGRVAALARRTHAPPGAHVCRTCAGRAAHLCAEQRCRLSCWRSLPRVREVIPRSLPKKEALGCIHVLQGTSARAVGTRTDEPCPCRRLSFFLRSEVSSYSYH